MAARYGNKRQRIFSAVTFCISRHFFFELFIYYFYLSAFCTPLCMFGKRHTYGASVLERFSVVIRNFSQCLSWITKRYIEHLFLGSFKILIVISHSFGKSFKCIPITSALSFRFNYLICRTERTISVCLIYIALFHRKCRRQYYVRIFCSIRHKSFMYNGKQVISFKSLDYRRCIADGINRV